MSQPKRAPALSLCLPSLPPQMGGTVFDLEEAELCYAPQYGSAKDVVNLAGEAAAIPVWHFWPCCGQRRLQRKRSAGSRVVPPWKADPGLPPPSWPCPQAWWPPMSCGATSRSPAG